MQGGGVSALAVFFGQKLQNLVVIGQAAFVAALEQACFDVMSGGKLLHGGKNAAFPPFFHGLGRRLQPFEQLMFVVVEFVNLFGGIAEQNAGQGKAQPVGLPWVEPKADQRGQRVCLGRIENGLARQQHALDTALFQFSGNHRRFVVGAH